MKCRPLTNVTLTRTDSDNWTPASNALMSERKKKKTANGKTTACERCLTRVAYANWKLFQYERTSAAPALGNIQQTAGS